MLRNIQWINEAAPMGPHEADGPRPCPCLLCCMGRLTTWNATMGVQKGYGVGYQDGYAAGHNDGFDEGVTK